jgi:hypothetical protein
MKQGITAERLKICVNQASRNISLVHSVVKLIMNKAGIDFNDLLADVNRKVAYLNGASHAFMGIPRHEYRRGWHSTST